MSHIHIPTEILLKILAHFRDGGPNSHVDLLSCCMVSRFWFDCAWPLASEFFKQDIPLDLDAYNAAQIDCVINAITKLRQLRGWKTTPFTSVATTTNKLLFEQTAHGSRADATVRLVHALQPLPKLLEIRIPYKFSVKMAANIQDFVSKLYSGTTSLRISGGRYHPESLKPSEPLEQLSILIRDLRHQLQDIAVTGTYPPSFIRALSNCPNIRSVSIESTSNVSDLMTTVLSWPELRTLKLLGNFEDIDPIVEQLALNTPNHLESLHFDHCKTPQLRNLIISLAPRIVRLVPPRSESTESSDEFLALITSLDMPCLRHLDLSQLADSLTAENVVQRHWIEGQSNPISLLHWPKLQRINLHGCFKISPRFLQLVMASCPALEGVRLGSGSIFDHTLDAGYSRSPESEAILADAGWTQNSRSLGHCSCGKSSPIVTFSRPGRNVWESEKWMEMVEHYALNKAFRRRLRIVREETDEDGVVVLVRTENKFV